MELTAIKTFKNSLIITFEMKGFNRTFSPFRIGKSRSYKLKNLSKVYCFITNV